MASNTINIRVNPDDLQDEIERIRKAMDGLSCIIGVGVDSISEAFRKLADAFNNNPQLMVDWETLTDKEQPNVIELKAKPSKLLLNLIDRLER